MKAGIFAAGTGSRFLEAGWREPKPLIRIQGRPLISYLLDNLFQAGVDRTEVLLNEEPRFDAVEQYLSERPEARRIHVSRKTTASSYESFAFLMERLGDPPYLLTTVDTIVSGRELKALLAVGSYPAECSLVLAVTKFVEDTKPLWVELSETGRVDRIGSSVCGRQWVTAGLYLVLKDLPGLAAGRTVPALRNYLEWVVDRVCVWGKEFAMALDIDSPEDVRLAERFARGPSLV
ncbi:MAG: NTP transferase domain-containing protein [bacterium]